MKIFWFVILSIIIYTSCEQPEAQKVFTGDKQFRTTDPSRIRFHNVRSVYYYRERARNTKMDIYKLRKFEMKKDKPLLIPVIVNNWMEDEAYLFFEKNLYPYYTDTITIKYQNPSDTLVSEGFYQLPLPNKKYQYEFGGQLFESITRGDDLFMKNAKNEFVPIYNLAEERLAFVTTLKDYYRLTEVY